MKGACRDRVFKALYFTRGPCPYPLSPLQRFPLYVPLSPLRPSVLSMALCLLNSPLSPLWPSVPSTALLKTANKTKWPLLFRENFKGFRDLFRISNDRDHHNNHDYHSSEILSENREIAIIALAKKVVIIAIITSHKER
jgi:hypothetical protein